MGGSAQAGRGGAGKEKEEGAPFSLEEVRDEDLYLIPEDDWALKPLSLGGLIQLLQMLDQLLEDADDLWDALKKVDEETLAEFISLLIRRPVTFIRENWQFNPAMRAVSSFWGSPDYRYLTSWEGPEEESEESEVRTPWLTSIIEKLSRDRGWTADYILGLPYLAVLKLLTQIEERVWDERNGTVIATERGVARAIARALGKGDSLPDLPFYRETRRKLKEAEQIKRKGKRFFDAAMR